MLLLAVPLILTALLFSDVQSQPALVPANCSDIEKDAGVALDLINKHRRDDDGYVFSLLRVANAHVQDAKNGSILYLTLDVMETECPVLSRKHWTTCDGRKFFAISDFGQCKAIVYLHPDSQRAKLYGYNCTVSPVPSHLYKCVDCPIRVTIVEDVDRYEKEAEKILEDYKQKNNETSYFKVEKVQKVFKAEASRLGYVIEFIIKETKCPSNGLATNETKCEFLPDGHTHRGFCTGRVAYGTEDGDVAEAESCEIYDIPDLEHHHHHNKTPGHGCRCSPPGSPHHHHHHHHHGPHHRHNHHHHSFGHRHGHGQYRPHDRHNHEHHYGHRRHGQHQGHECPPCPDHYHHDHKGPMDHHNSSDIPPPPGPHYPPPPPPGGPHHLPPSKYPSPPVGPPPPSSKHHDHPTQPWRDSKRGHWHRRHHDNQTSDERGRGSSHEDDPDSFRDPHFFHRREIGSVHRIPVLGKGDVLVAPGANFIDHPCKSHRCHEKHPFPSKGRHEKPIMQRFPDILSGSCPGDAKYNPLHVLDLYPPPLTQ